MKPPQRYLRDMLHHLDLIEQFTQHGRDHFMQDAMQQFAVIRAYEVLGEIVKRLPDALLAAYPAVDWQTLRRFRDFIVHNYEDIVLPNIWVAVSDVPRLRQVIQHILNQLPPNND